MTNFKFDPKERLEVTKISMTHKTYLITFNPFKKPGEQRTLYLVGADGKSLKKIATAQTPPAFDQKIV